MTERLVTCFRWFERTTHADEYLAVASDVTHALGEIGGQPIAWGADRYSFAFSRSLFHEALSVTLRVMSRHSALGASIAMRALVQDAGRSWGPALTIAEALASAARRGEILLDPATEAVSNQALATVGVVPVDIGPLTISAGLILAGATSVGGVRSSLPPELGAEPVPLRTPVSSPSTSGRPAARDLSPAAELLTSVGPVNLQQAESEEAVELSSSAVDSAVPTPRQIERALERAESSAHVAGPISVGPISVDEDRPTLADSPRASVRGPETAQFVEPNTFVASTGAAGASGASSAEGGALAPAVAGRRALSSDPPAAREPETFLEPPPGTLPSSELLDVPSRVTPAGPPPLLHRSVVPSVGEVRVSDEPPLSLDAEDRLSQIRPPPKPTRSSAPDLPAYTGTETADSMSSAVPAPTAVVSMPPPRVSAPPPKPAGKSRAPGARRLSDPPPKPSRTPDSDPDRHSAVEEVRADAGRAGSEPLGPSGSVSDAGAMDAGLQVDETSAMRDRPLNAALQDHELEAMLNLEGIPSVTDGDWDQGLLRLREAVRAAQQRETPNQSQLRLALAVALLRAGRTREAYLESLQALSRARQTTDAKAERDSARLLAHLTRTAGYEHAAQRWDDLVH